MSDPGVVYDLNRVLDKYWIWMQANVPDNRETAASITLKMQQAFPELTRVRGRVSTASRDDYKHYWLESWGVIIDPQIGLVRRDCDGYTDGVEVKP